MAGLVQDHHRVDPGYTPAFQQPLGPNPLQAFPKPDNESSRATNAAAQPPLTAAPQPALANRSQGAFDLTGTTIDAGASLLEAYAPRLDTSDPLPLPPTLFNDSGVARLAEAPVSVPLPPMFWPAVITLSLCALLRRIAVAPQGQRVFHRQ
jgi:hypothetical protein